MSLGFFNSLCEKFWACVKRRDYTFPSVLRPRNPLVPSLLKIADLFWRGQNKHLAFQLFHSCTQIEFLLKTPSCTTYQWTYFQGKSAFENFEHSKSFWDEFIYPRTFNPLPQHIVLRRIEVSPRPSKIVRRRIQISPRPFKFKYPPRPFPHDYQARAAHHPHRTRRGGEQGFVRSGVLFAAPTFYAILTSSAAFFSPDEQMPLQQRRLSPDQLPARQRSLPVPERPGHCSRKETVRGEWSPLVESNVRIVRRRVVQKELRHRRVSSEPTFLTWTRLLYWVDWLIVLCYVDYCCQPDLSHVNEFCFQLQLYLAS